MNLGQQHLSARERLFKKLEPFPSEGTFKRFLDYLMYGVGLVQWLALVPQVIQIYGGHTAAGLSLITWLLLTIFNLLWAFYGAVHREKPIFISNTLLFLLDLIIVVGVLRYS